MMSILQKKVFIENIFEKIVIPVAAFAFVVAAVASLAAAAVVAAAASFVGFLGLGDILAGLGTPAADIPVAADYPTF